MRLSVVPSLSTKDAVANKNARMTNVLNEKGKGVIRPGMTTVTAYTGLADGVIPFGDHLLVIVDDVIYIEDVPAGGGDVIPSGDTFPLVLVPNTLRVLLHFNGTNGSVNTIDEYGNAVLIAGTGGQLSSTYKKFGTTSLTCMNGGAAGGYALVTGPTALGASAGWTLECWFYCDDSVVDYHSRGLISAVNTSGYGANLYMAGPNLTQPAPLAVAMYLSSNGTSDNIYSGSLTTAYNTPTQQWNHIALVYDATAATYYSYVNGTKLHEVASASSICPITRIWVGRDNSNNTYIGWIDEFRLSDSCRYPGGLSFEVPTAAFLE